MHYAISVVHGAVENLFSSIKQFILTWTGWSFCSFMPLKDQSNSTVMKPAVDEMFPEGAGPYVDLDEVRQFTGCRISVLIDVNIELPYRCHRSLCTNISLYTNIY